MPVGFRGTCPTPTSETVFPALVLEYDQGMRMSRVKGGGYDRQERIKAVSSRRVYLRLRPFTRCADSRTARQPKT